MPTSLYNKKVGGKYMVLESERLYVRELCQDDMKDLCEILQDEEVMVAYEHAFCLEEVQIWLQNQLRRYKEDGFGLWAVIRKADGKMIGQCGLTLQNVDETTRLEIGYLLKKEYWHQGYAIEAARACKQYAFDVLHADCVCSIIRDTNTASQKVAIRNGMKPVKRVVKHYYGMDMPHDIYEVRKGL